MKRAVATPPGRPTAHVDMTPQQIAARQAEEAEWADSAPMRSWLVEIATTDSKLPRALEDVIDAMGDDVKQKLAKETKDAYDLKKTIRNNKPGEN